MRSPPLGFSFAVALFFALFQSALLPHIPLVAFSPYLAMIYGRYSLLRSLWVAFGCGLCIDLFSTELRFGIHALNYVLVTLFLFKQRHHFFQDKPLSVCLFTGLISTTSTLLQWLLLPLCGHPFVISAALLITDVIILPLVDMAYALLAFCLPLLLYAQLKKVGWRYYLMQIYRYFPWHKKDTGNSCN